VHTLASRASVARQGVVLGQSRGEQGGGAAGDAAYEDALVERDTPYSFQREIFLQREIFCDKDGSPFRRTRSDLQMRADGGFRRRRTLRRNNAKNPIAL
jgi:hypothetical protein